MIEEEILYLVRLLHSRKIVFDLVLSTGVRVRSRNEDFFEIIDSVTGVVREIPFVACY